jgi:DNA-binding transcriptional LysR family regulator
MTTNARLRALVELADTGSVRAAAERLYVTESSVSAAITALARDVGVRLVRKQGRGIELTEAGAAYARYARSILGLYEQALLAAQGEHSPETGSVRLAAVTTAGEHVLPLLLASFRAKHPRVDIRLEVAPRDAVWRMLEHHEVDLVVAGRPPETIHARVRALHPNALVVVGAPAAAERFSAETVTWLLREEGSGTRETCLGMLATLETRPVTLTLGSNGAVVAGAAAGLGVTLVSRQAVEVPCATGELVELPMSGVPLDRPWHAVTHDQLTGPTELLIRHLIADPDGGWVRA